MEFIEQKSSSKFVVLDRYKENYEMDRQILLEEGDKFYGKIIDIFEDPEIGLKIRFATGKFDEKKKEFIENGEEATWTPQTYLVSALGLNPDFKRSHKAEKGDVVCVQYTGRDASKTNNPYTFKVSFGK